eukprot:COSAG01_NODE_1487_length_10136_cov_8.813390_6_plen_770_part_00
MSAECLKIIGNAEIIALNQDANVQRAKLVLQYPDPLPFGINTTWVPPQAPPPPEGAPAPPKDATMSVHIKLQVWVKHLANGDVGVVAFNRQENESIVANITANMLGLGGWSADVRDLWLHESVAQHVTAYSAAVAPMDSLALRFTPHSRPDEVETQQQDEQQQDEKESLLHTGESRLFRVSRLKTDDDVGHVTAGHSHGGGLKTPIPPPGPERNENGSLVVHNNSCFSGIYSNVPFTDSFAPAYPAIAPRYHICNSCHSENDPCAAFYYKGMYHYMYQEHDSGGTTGGHAVSRDLVMWQEMPTALWPSEWFISAAVWDFSATIVDNVPSIIAAGVVAPGAKKNESDPNSPWCHVLAVPSNLSDPTLRDWVYPKDLNPTMCGTKLNHLKPGDSPSNTWRTASGEYRYVDAYGMVYTTFDFRSWNQAKNASPAPVGSSFPVGCCQDMFELPACCVGCDGKFLGEGEPKVPTHVWTGWPPGTPGMYELTIYHEGPVNSSGVKEVVQLGLPSYGLNFTWLDWGHYAATKSFYDPVKSRRIVQSWLAPDVDSGAKMRPFKYNTQGLLREVRYDPRLRLLTTFPIEEISQLRIQPPLARLPKTGILLKSSKNITFVRAGANQTELRFKFSIDPWPALPTMVGCRVMTVNHSCGIELIILVYPQPESAKVWRARAIVHRRSLGGPNMLGEWPLIAGEDIEVAVFLDSTWIEWFIARGRFAQTVAVPMAALNGSATQSIEFFTNVSDGTSVHLSTATAWKMRSIWHNTSTHDRPGPP